MASWVLTVWLRRWGQENGDPMLFEVAPDDVGETIAVQVLDFKTTVRRGVEGQRRLRGEPASIFRAGEDIPLRFGASDQEVGTAIAIKVALNANRPFCQVFQGQKHL